MASNISNQVDYDSIVSRIKSLSEHNQRKWGTMSVDQMLVHCSNQLKLGLSIIQQDTFEGPSIMRTKFGRWLLLYVLPWTRGLPTPSRMNMAKAPIVDLEPERKVLLELLDQAQKDLKLHPHPFFGALNEKDWGRLIWKHINYHLKQFGG